MNHLLIFLFWSNARGFFNKGLLVCRFFLSFQLDRERSPVDRRWFVLPLPFVFVLQCSCYPREPIPFLLVGILYRQDNNTVSRSSWGLHSRKSGPLVSAAFGHSCVGQVYVLCRNNQRVFLPLLQNPASRQEALFIKSSLDFPGSGIAVGNPDCVCICPVRVCYHIWRISFYFGKNVRIQAV